MDRRHGYLARTTVEETFQLAGGEKLIAAGIAAP
jgi:hypothetical protein